MDIKLFQKKDGGVIQLIDKKKMEDWPVELPLLFIEYIREKKLDTYGDNKVKKEIEKYLDEVMREVAVPRLIGVLKGKDDEEIILALKRIEEIAKKNIEMVNPIRTYLNDLKKSKNNQIIKISEDILNLFVKEKRRKELAKKRKIMQQKEKEFMAGKIDNEEYAKIRKEYLLLRD